ncbi:S-layer homology domain-containing protein [Paenibacillus sp. GCM10027626]|uniref:S-layer homology domain-containing protein n=1 Tax=Paenibacillus sp. GCM10027626 TaxID=3273411 RepID=UPI003629EF11
MNATWVLNNESSVELNDASLEQCEAVGLECMVLDTRLIMYPFTVEQTIADEEWLLSNSSSLGQTFTTTSDPFTAINTIELFIDRSDWTEGSTATLSIYDSPAKKTLMGSSTVSGPYGEDYSVFNIYKWFSPNTTYYMELTSNTLTPFGVKRSASDVYEGGTAYEGGIAQSNHDMWFKVNYNHKIYEGAPRPTTVLIDEIADRYKTNPALLGYFIVDEPSAKGMTGIQATIERFRQADPDHMTLVNLLPNYASEEDLFRESHSGDYVTPSQSLGQTFKTNAVTTSISTIQLFIGDQWDAGETITLKLWDSPAKTTLLGEDTKDNPNVGGFSYPKFSINAAVSPNTTYYWELTHNGGGGNAVGWVVHGENGSDWEKDGTGYKNGTSMNSDFWFTINQDIAYRSYEDYVYRWANKRPDVLMFDYYPFRLGSGINENGYYNNLEIIRRQALAAKIDFWSFIQSVAEPGSLRKPNEAELRYQVYTNLAYGAKGINYFTYRTLAEAGLADAILLPDGTKSPLYDYAKNLNAGVLKLGPTLQGLKSEAVYHTGNRPQGTQAVPANFFWQPADSSQPMIISSFTNESGRKYIMVVNRDIVNSRMISFSIPTKPGSVKEVSKITGAETSTNYNSMAGTLSGSFAPGEGKLYVLDDESGSKLGSLSLEDGDGAAIALTPAFDPGLTDYEVQVPYGVTGVRLTAVTQSAYASFDINGDRAQSGDPSLEYALDLGDNEITVHVIAQNGDELTYRIKIHRLADFPGVPTDVSAVAGDGQATISFKAPAYDGGNPITGYEVISSPGSFVVTSTTSPITVSGLTNGQAYTFTVRAINSTGPSADSAVTNAVTPRADSPIGSIWTPVQPEKSADMEGLVNGKTAKIGKVTTTKVDNRTVTTLVIDRERIQDMVATEGPQTVLTIPAKVNSDVVIVELDGQTVRSMELKQTVIDVVTLYAGYTLPVQQINIQALSEQLGKGVDLQEVKVTIEVSKSSAGTVKLVENAAAQNHYVVVAPPVDFTVKAVYEGNSIEVSKFNSYVERTIAIPDGVDLTKITTGVAIDPDGTVRHIPTKVIVVDGRYYAKINSLTNGTYSVIWHPYAFADTANHWAGSSINDLGSRLVVDGVGNDLFQPNRSITRAEFAAILLRGLGLKVETGSHPFTDVNASDWYGGVIRTAYAYNLVNGFEDGTFRPQDRITREQAMTMIAKAMTLTGLKSKLPNREANELLHPFADGDTSSTWAVKGIADCLLAGVVSGRSGSVLAPKAFISRAEVAVIVQRLLQKSAVI